MTTCGPLLPDALNLRDLGGLETHDGRRVRTGRLLRADRPTYFDRTDADNDALGIRTVVDLRRRNEADLACSDWERLGIGYHRMPVVARADSSWKARYRSYLDDYPQTLSAAVRLVLDPGNHPVLFHCAAGKDRTAVVAALALSALGVRDDEIVADYLRSAPAVEAILSRLTTADLYARMLDGETVESQTPRAEYLEDFLVAVAEHGGAVTWLVRHGVPEAEIEQAREQLLTTS